MGYFLYVIHNVVNVLYFLQYRLNLISVLIPVRISDRSVKSSKLLDLGLDPRCGKTR